jgi:hypothetical protein
VAREKWLDPSNWASLKPFGIGEEHPNNYLELWNAFRENRDQARYAWRILSQGTCDGCALGTKGMRDWTTRQVHLCNVRLRLLRLNTMPALDPALLADVTSSRASAAPSCATSAASPTRWCAAGASRASPGPAGTTPWT